MKISIDNISNMSSEEIANNLRKAANNLSPLKPESKGSRRFPIPAAREIFEHFDDKMKKTIDGIKKDIDRILGE